MRRWLVATPLDSFAMATVVWGCGVLPRTRSAAVRTVPAELVVDAMGAGSRTCLWLADMWDTRVPIERLSAPHLAEPADTFTRTAYLRRRFDHAERLPGGIIALGGSLCSLGSQWGQSLNLALYHTDTLQRLLREETPNGSRYHSHLFPRRYFEAAMRIPCC